jgi:hypothetical protein
MQSAGDSFRSFFMDFQSLIAPGVQIALLGAGFIMIWKLAASDQLRRHMWPFAIAWTGFSFAVTYFVSEPLFWPGHWFGMFWDFECCYWEAGNLVWDGPQALSHIYETEKLTYLNLPIVSYLFSPFGLMPDHVASSVFALLGILCALVTWKMLVRLYDLSSRDSALLLLAFSTFGPLLYSIKIGNTSHIVLLLVLAGLMSVRAGKGFSAGVLFAICVLIKPALVLIGFLYFLRGRWPVVAGGAVTLVTAVALSLLVFGWDMHVSWYENAIRPYSGNPLPAFNNQNLPAFLSRSEFGQPPGRFWTIVPLSAGSKLLSSALSLLLVAGLAFAAWKSGRFLRATDKDVEIEVLMAVMLALLVSTVSWTHYYVWLVPALVMLWNETRAGKPLSNLTWLLGAAFALTAGLVYLSVPMSNGAFEPFGNLIVSHYTYGALIVLFLLAVLRMQKAPETIRSLV